MWVFNFGQNRRIFHARVLLDGGAIQDIDRHYPQNPRTARLKTCSGRLIRRVSRLCTKKRPRYRGSIGQHRLLRCRSCSLCSALPRLGVAPRRWAVAAAARGFDRAPGDHRFCRRPRRNSASVVIESVRIKYWHAEAKGASGPLALFCPEMQRLPGTICWFDKVHRRVSVDVLATLQLSEQLSRGAELRWCEFLVANHEDVAIDESAIERAARLRVHRPGRIEVADLRSGVLCRRAIHPWAARANRDPCLAPPNSRRWRSRTPATGTARGYRREAPS